ncbi:NAD(P)H-binding protein [Rhodococcus sp. HM1]|uniref:NAD(P)-dependent oxidoreductase n=1 Tax=Rhodococcus sp. HM1 TaxID=2937759 RepID=UPI00200A7C52|nr:NAD(P)H-binding protein [Rhodococcus sp. HM1]MCK8674034.1 NAD(P)H-binding protein [Rhodococcus sp. HM1]
MTELRVAVLGAGGRAGSAVVRRILTEGHSVTALVRARARHPWLAQRGVTVVEGDATDAADVARALADADAVNAVTPFSAPPPSFDGFDETFYARVLGAILAGRRSPDVRIVTVGLFANLRLPDGRAVSDVVDLFPQELLPFARAHAGERTVLSQADPAPDWLIVTPPAGLSSDAAEVSAYTLTEVVGPEALGAALSYETLAAAVVDEIVMPTVRQRQVLVLPAA